MTAAATSKVAGHHPRHGGGGNSMGGGGGGGGGGGKGGGGDDGVGAATSVSDIDFNEMLIRDPLFSNPYAPDFMRQALGVEEHARIFGELEGEGVGEGCGYMYLRTRQNKGWAEQVRVLV